MTMGVVYLLEVIHVEQQHSHGRSGAQHTRDLAVQSIEQSRAVPEAGERVVGGLEAELFLGRQELLLENHQVGQGIDLFLMSGFTLFAQLAGLIQLGANLTGLCVDLTAEESIPDDDNERC